MKTLIAIAAALVTVNIAAQAEIVRGHFRSNGTYVAPYYRTPANGIPYDNLSYRGYPSQQPGYVSPRSGFDSGFTRPAPMPSFDCDLLGTKSRRKSSDLFDDSLQTLPNWGTGYKSRTLDF